MNKLTKFMAGGAMLALCLSCGNVSDKTTTKKNDYIVAAYVWPSCHDDSLAHANLWGEGIGEWEVIKQGDKRFEGHYQPKQPLWGYEMDNDPQVVEKWINTALEYGVNTFVYDWYWFDNGPYLESALNDGFLGAPSNEKMNFYIMWANHNVKHNYWNYHRHGDDESLLWGGAVDRENFEKIVHRVIEQYFKRPNYLKIDGCPIFSIFDFGLLINGLGGDDQTADALAYLREEVKKAGFPDVHLQMIEGGGPTFTETYHARIAELVEKLNINSIAYYNMGGFDTDYLVHGANAEKIREQWDEALDIPLFPCVSIGWDDTPRFPAKGAEDVTRYHNTPVSFGAFLKDAKDYADRHPEQPKIITINAWNEWIEGSYLLPDKLNGYGYLEAVKDVFDGKYE